MSDPTPEGTIRGWLEAIAGALGATGLLQAILAELRYNNQRMWGGDAAGGVLADPLAPALRSALTHTLGAESNSPGTYGLASLLALLTGPNGANLSVQARLNGANISLQQILQALMVDGDGETAANLLQFLVTLNGSTNQYLTQGAGSDSQAGLLRDIATAVGAGTTQAATIAAAQAAAAATQTGLLECICDNTAPEGGPSDPPAFVASECFPQDTLTATYTFNGSITDTGALAGAVTLAASPGNFASSPAGTDGAARLRLNTSAESQPVCVQIAVAPEYTGTVTASLTPYLIGSDTLSTRPQMDILSGSEGETWYAWQVTNENPIAYVCSVAVGPSDPALPGEQVRVYVAREVPS